MGPSGSVTDRYDYEAFGNLTFNSGTAANAYRYAGEQYDPDLGLYYNRARYVNTDSGRFWSMDGFEGMLEEPASLHKYLYAHANPVMFNDLSGNAISIVQLMGVAGSKILDRMATISSVRYFRRVAGGLCKAAKTMLMPFNQFYNYVSKVSPFQRHHVFRNESMVALFETYARPLGMAIALLGGSAHPGSPRDRATRYQNRVAKYNWPTEKVAYGALLAAGCSVSDAREIVKAVQNYNELKKWIP